MFGEVVRKHQLLCIYGEIGLRSLGKSKRLRSRLGTTAAPVEESWAASNEDILVMRSTEENEETVTDLVELFKLADKDGYGPRWSFVLLPGLRPRMSLAFPLMIPWK